MIAGPVEGLLGFDKIGLAEYFEIKTVWLQASGQLELSANFLQIGGFSLVAAL